MEPGKRPFRRKRARRTRCSRAGAAAAALILGGCAGPQSALDPGGPVARTLAQTWWVLAIGAAAIFALVLALFVYALLRDREKRPVIGSRALIVAGGIALPAVVLTALLFYTVNVSDRVRAAPPDALRVEVVGHQWWWEVRYPDYPNAVGANEIRVPIGRPVQVEVVSNDVVHSFWVPRLAGKIDVLPEQRNRVWFQADAAGIYPGQCAEFCGAQHARMRLLVIAEAGPAFERTLARLRRPARRPQTPAETRGREAFLRNACVACHAIRGTPAGARIGPDLTHVAGRRTLAAGSLPNTRGNLMAWIADSQAIKPGNRMPPFPDLAPGVLADLSAYLGSLE